MNKKWDSLSMRERSELISLYTKNGISSLNDIREEYNSFDEGGEITNGLDNSAVTNRSKELNWIHKHNQDQGLSREQSIALLSNYIVESSLDARANEKGGNGYGLMQHTENSRKSPMLKYSRAYEFDGSGIDPEVQRQAYYITSTIDKKISGEWRHSDDHHAFRFKNAEQAQQAFYDNSKSVKDLTLIASQNYVRPGIPHLDRRLKASSYLDQNLPKKEEQLYNKYWTYKNK